jgi:hypothetical protein
LAAIPIFVLLRVSWKSLAFIVQEQLAQRVLQVVLLVPELQVVQPGRVPPELAVLFRMLQQAQRSQMYSSVYQTSSPSQQVL